MKKIYFIPFITLFSIIKLSATTYYVSSVKGSNSNNGLTQNTAFGTLQLAADKVSAGDSVLVLNGTYSGFDLRTGGTSGAAIVFKAIEPDVLINKQGPIRTDGINIETADWIVIEGFTIKGVPGNGIRLALSANSIVRNNYCDGNFRGIFTGFADNILIENNTCINSFGEHGIYFSNSADYPIIRNNICHHNVSCGIQINADISQGGDGITTGATINGNLLYENGTKGGAAINLDGAQQSLIYNNLIYSNHSTGLVLYRGDAAEGCANSKAYNNTIIVPAGARWGVNIANSPGVSIFNNIIINQDSRKGSIVIESGSLPNFQSDYNIVVNSLSNTDDSSPITFTDWQKLGYDNHSKLAGPLTDIFIDPSNNDYHLKTGSQAIDAGKDISGLFAPYDFDNILRSGLPDVGAYEYKSTITAVNEEATDLTKCYLENNNGKLLFKNIHQGDKIYIYNLDGRLINTFLSESTEVSWEIQHISAGLYFYNVNSSRNTKILNGKIFIENR